ncbi:MAG: sigma 54-interacting transcriptional regulator [Thermosediminibacteraceae bacterium]|nr:sigma 54-interacting transcriptional regulator [Thermosediminibacteraceae bacterium]
MLGADDGGMESEDLKIIGVDPEGIKRGYAVVAVGKKGSKIGSALYESAPPGYDGELSIETVIDGILIRARISFNKKRLEIKINESNFNYDYLWAAGHMVILNGKDHHIKFYQCRGYTSRKEDMKLVLLGQPFKGKGKYRSTFDPLNKHILELHPETELLRALLNVARGSDEIFRGIESFINGIPVRCSIKALNEGDKRIGALLEIMEITELRAIQEKWEQALVNLNNLKNKVMSEKIKEQAFKSIIGHSHKIINTIEIAKKAAETDSTVLLLGESGTGKNLFAEAIHKASPRRDGPFVYINCAAIPENLLESELFGYEKGAFTGATSQKLGKFEQANHGTIFLDEINELPLVLQAKLLHVLQNRTFTRIGGLKPINVNVRIIVASNKDLGKLITEGKFRSDLFYRINVLSITIPPLRERKEDLYLLSEYIVERLRKKLNCCKKLISPEVFNIFFDYDWPGNIRELENVLERAMIMSEKVICPEHLPEYMLREAKQYTQKKTFVDIKNVGPIKLILEEAEKKAIIKALEITDGSRKKAMELLKMGKTNFYIKLKKFSLLE